MINSVVIMGRLTYEPELRATPSGVSVVRFQVAVDRNYQKAGEERKTDFIDCTAWRQTAEFVCKYFHKGSMIRRGGFFADRQLHGPERRETQERAAGGQPGVLLRL